LPELEDPPPDAPLELLAPPLQLVSTRASTRARAASASVPFIVIGLLREAVGLAWTVIR
jgi:hypothetical protein